MAGDQVCVHIWVSGRVQGVGFRAYVLQIGYSLGLLGWVRNVGYDRVETVAEGFREVLEQFIQLVRKGPRASRVDDIQVSWEEPRKTFKRFEIR
jgi:acylphosphatase